MFIFATLDALERLCFAGAAWRRLDSSVCGQPFDDD
jgi:hypothetical protein